MGSSFSPLDVAAVVQPCPLQTTDPKKPVHWISIVLLGEGDQPIEGEEYQIKLPSGGIAKGFTDEKGSARVEGIPDAGVCSISFPQLDKDAWEEIS
jgi:hypothetical protein